MGKTLTELLKGYQIFCNKYAKHDESLMKMLAEKGQTPKTLVISCSDSRVDPAILLQCDPGELFVVRNVANIVPPFKSDEFHHGTSAAIEFAVCYLKVKDLIVLGHSDCGGLKALLSDKPLPQDDFITNWVSILDKTRKLSPKPDFAKSALLQSYENCLTFPWINKLISKKELNIHLWYLDIPLGQINSYDFSKKEFHPLEKNSESKMTSKL